MCLWRRLTICGDLPTVNPFNTAGPIRGNCFIVRNRFPAHTKRERLAYLTQRDRVDVVGGNQV